MSPIDQIIDNFVGTSEVNGKKISPNKAEISKCTYLDCSLFPYRKSTVDRSAEIKPITKIGHIEPVSGNKIEKEYQSADQSTDIT